MEYISKKVAAYGQFVLVFIFIRVKHPRPLAKYASKPLLPNFQF